MMWVADETQTVTIHFSVVHFEQNSPRLFENYSSLFPFVLLVILYFTLFGKGRLLFDIISVF